MDPYDYDEDADPVDHEIESLGDALQSSHTSAVQRVQASQSVPLGQDGRVAIDIPCIQCGYNLRAMMPENRCPECGNPVQRSLRSDQLRMANARWLGTIAQGTAWLIGAIFTSIALTVLLFVVTLWMFSRSASPSGPMGSIEVLKFVQAGIALISSVLFGIAYWMMTAPEPGVIQPRISRGIARWTLIPGYLISLLASLLEIDPDPIFMMAAGIIDGLSMILLLVGLIASLIYLRHLARRVPDAKLARQTGIVLWGLPISLGTFLSGAFVVGFLMAASFSSPNSSGSSPAGAAMGLLLCPLGLGVLVFSIWWIVLIFFYRGRFAQAHRHARQAQRNPNPVELDPMAVGDAP